MIKTKDEAERDELRIRFRAKGDDIVCETAGCSYRKSTSLLATGNPGVYHLMKHSKTHAPATSWRVRVRVREEGGKGRSRRATTGNRTREGARARPSHDQHYVHAVHGGCCLRKGR